ncbi:uncharacterized protein P174DRAFT_436203 [Aspergillus novofumigatus IBT 16806]|uniref:Uncharacterized protein n=1 Tax=Aspergillus novofumigatus (strain IBT 16806) TaxID=1392255 RepID=A0A2I1BSS1_ASPN1|nr:uncharacterized protein P174DRAFT_436203 [Aspergillus novofumigatus IBT 16806]PKX88447.1 hypothetical protein P174DRAFT_436203 [Aspergillus novofumigatus IBT 16806]
MKLPILLFISLLPGASFGAVENANLIRDHVTCNEVQFTRADIERAANAALLHHNAGTTVGPYPPGDGRNYPKRFNNRENIPLAPNCNNAQLEEFPLVRTIVYPGGTPASQRVAVNYPSNNQNVRVRQLMYSLEFSKAVQYSYRGYAVAPLLRLTWCALSMWIVANFLKFSTREVNVGT